MRNIYTLLLMFIVGSSLSYGLKVSWTDIVYDQNGNVTELLDGESGDVIGEYAYDPYGNLTKIKGEAAFENKVRFSTKEVDGSGNYYYGYRYYNPQDGRWLNRDPIEEVWETDELNMYTFVKNLPVSYIDNLGNSAVMPVIVGGGLVVGGYLWCKNVDIPDQEKECALKTVNQLGDCWTKCKGLGKISDFTPIKHTPTCGPVSGTPVDCGGTCDCVCP